jgi:hypothetical protein
MRPYQRAQFLRAVRRILPAILALAASGGAIAQTPLAMTVHTVTAVGQPPAVEHDFTITNAGNYSVTLTDLGSKLTSPLTPAPLASVAMAVTQGASIVGTPVTAAGTAITFTATANTTYTIHVVGIPGTVPGSGPIEEDVTDSSGNKVFSSIDTLSTASQQPSTVGILADSVTVQTSGSYTVALTDLAFPAALQVSALLLIDNTAGTSVVELTNTSSSTVTLTAGDAYEIVAYGVENGQTGGLFGVSVTPAGSAAIYAKLIPVGPVTLLQTSVSGTPQPSFSLGSGGATLSLTDLSFPTVPLSSAGAVVVDATAQTLAGPAVTTTGTQTFTPPSTSDTYEVYAYAIPDSTANDGSYSVSVQQGTAFPFLAAQGVSSVSTIQAFTFDTSAPAAGSYVFTLKDFQFPASLTADALMEVQAGQQAKSINAAGTFTAQLSQGPVTLLAFGAEGSSGGLMGIDLSPAAGGASVFDVTEGIGTGFSSTTFTATSAQSVQANVADLKFPTALANLDLAVTSGMSLVGSISSAGSSGSFPFQASANTSYNVNVLAQPASQGSSQQESAGTYAMSVDPAPVVTLTASSASVASGGTVTLTWNSQNATSCTASASPSNSAWSGTESASGGPVTTAALTASTTFSLSCTGGGGTGSASATVNVSAASTGGGHSGGGAIDPELLLALAVILALRIRAASRRSVVRQP